MLRLLKTVILVNKRTFKNFGHKREPVPGVTVLWHGFLTFTFIGMMLDWKKFARYFFGDYHGVEEAPWDSTISDTSKTSNS